MDEETYRRCLQHLAAAEGCMVEGIDGCHLARFSMVVDCLKEAYGPGAVASRPSNIPCPMTAMSDYLARQASTIVALVESW